MEGEQWLSQYYSQKTISGRKGDPGEGADMTFLRPKLSMLPIKALAVREYAREYPQNIHWNVTLDVVSMWCCVPVSWQTYTPITANDWNNIANADLRRERPEYRKPIPGMIRNTRKDMIIR
jgi:hypothetical protein